MTTPNTTDRMEEARRVVVEAIHARAGASIGIGGLEAAALVIERALSTSEAKGRQDGVREGMKRAKRINETLCLDCTGQSRDFIDGTDFARKQVSAAILSNIDEAK